jgi:transcriptional regulator with XRE-family HTH domain
MQNDGLRFTELCELLKVTKYRIAKDTGVSENTLSYWSRGITTPTIDILLKISKYLGVSIAYFYDDQEVDVERYGVYGKLQEQIQILTDRPDIAEYVLIAAKAGEDDMKTITKITKALNNSTE